MCLGSSITLDATGTQAVTWTGVPSTSSEEDIFIADEQGVPFESTIAVSNFQPGQTLTDCNDLQSICIDFEHSFMGDLVITLTCPNGSVQTLHQQNGGGTNLGIPGAGTGIGTTYTYCWSPTATNGTWAASAGGQATLPAGTYSPVENCNDLVGCPLNGTWTLTFLDLWGADDGWLTGWGLQFQPRIDSGCH
ncbi:MAG: proprotein convertase P-domain-containing protein [Flavobacteriales bacterium]|nr:proprotein convertase P-domain-containing protein [Flavobacteriales bacterium]